MFDYKTVSSLAVDEFPLVTFPPHRYPTTLLPFRTAQFGLAQDIGTMRVTKSPTQHPLTKRPGRESAVACSKVLGGELSEQVCCAYHPFNEFVGHLLCKSTHRTETSAMCRNYQTRFSTSNKINSPIDFVITCSG